MNSGFVPAASGVETHGMVRWATAIISGLLIGCLTFFLLGILLGRMFDGVPPWDTVAGVIVPVVLGLLAGCHSFRRSLLAGREGEQPAEPEQ